jgi:hypothetical protein
MRKLWREIRATIATELWGLATRIDAETTYKLGRDLVRIVERKP